MIDKYGMEGQSTGSRLLVASCMLGLLAGCQDSFELDEEAEVPSYASALKLGGDTTDVDVSPESKGVFAAPAANLSKSNLELHELGDENFEQPFVAAPSDEHPRFDGLGPVSNNKDCAACHPDDGRGSPPPFTETWKKLGDDESLFLRISIETDDAGYCVPAAVNNYCAPVAVPGFSDQLFHRGLPQLRPDSPGTGQADVYIRYETQEIEYLDGERITLRKPVFQIRNPYDSPGEKPGDNTPPVSRLFQDDVRAGARIGNHVFGLGLLEAVSEQDILALADEDDADGDGISGRPNRVLDPEKKMSGDPEPVSLGRFGWKANTPSIAVQSLGALRGDIGITNFLFPEESIAGTPLHDDYLSRNPDDTGRDAEGNPEADDEFSDSVVFYIRTLHVPARRNIDDPTVIRGARLFDAAGCAACHHPQFVTRKHPAGIVELENQEIFPFTDMLLHDMGEGLADGRRDFQATGTEWRTPPLWGIGLTKIVNPDAGFLHDGRASTLEEAILWHGGEAETAKENFRTMKKGDRNALIKFLESL